MTRLEAKLKAVDKQRKRLAEAQQKARELLARKPSQELRNQFFEAVYPVAREYLEHLLEYGHGNKHINDAFMPRVLRMAFGDDIFALEDDLRLFGEMDCDSEDDTGP